MERITMKLFEVFIEWIEDWVDLFYCLMRRNEPNVPFEEVITQLKRDGKLVD
jgi:hypothetical protein